jgi:hypothetical protein
VIRFPSKGDNRTWPSYQCLSICQLCIVEGGGRGGPEIFPVCRFNVLNVQLQKYIYYWSLEILHFMFDFPCSPVHKICLLFTELNNEDRHIFRDSELRKLSANTCRVYILFILRIRIAIFF